MIKDGSLQKIEERYGDKPLRDLKKYCYTTQKLTFSKVRTSHKGDRNDLTNISNGLQIEPRGARIDVDWSQPDLALC